MDQLEQLNLDIAARVGAIIFLISFNNFTAARIMLSSSRWQHYDKDSSQNGKLKILERRVYIGDTSSLLYLQGREHTLYSWILKTIKYNNAHSWSEHYNNLRGMAGDRQQTTKLSNPHRLYESGHLLTNFPAYQWVTIKQDKC